MGQIVPFTGRASPRGGFSGEERARLAELAERFAAAGVRVEVVYGATEDGDPWCVVKDQDEEVLIHVARIGDVFVVHYALEDALRQGQDLRSVLNDRLAWEDRPEVVVPFSRQAQSLLALIVAASFLHDTAPSGADAIPAEGLAPVDDPAVAAAAATALPPHLETALAAKTLHAEAAGLAALGGAGFAAARPVLWTPAVDETTPLRMDHAGFELARFSPDGPAAPVANLEVAAPRAPDGPAPMVMAFDARPHAPPAAPDTPAAASFTVASLSTSRKTDDPPPAPAPEHALVATHWVEVDTDGDGRPDTRVAVPDAPKAGEPEPAAPADHAAILAVGHGFPHAEIV